MAMASSRCAARCCQAITKRWWPPNPPNSTCRRISARGVGWGSAWMSAGWTGTRWPKWWWAATNVFAYYLNDHHGDGIVSVCCKVLPGDNEALVAAQPAKFYMPAYIGPRGWVGLRLDVSGLDWNEVAEMVVGSYKLIAPRRLAL